MDSNRITPPPLPHHRCPPAPVRTRSEASGTRPHHSYRDSPGNEITPCRSNIRTPLDTDASRASNICLVAPLFLCANSSFCVFQNKLSCGAAPHFHPALSHSQFPYVHISPFPAPGSPSPPLLPSSQQPVSLHAHLLPSIDNIPDGAPLLATHRQINRCNNTPINSNYTLISPGRSLAGAGGVRGYAAVVKWLGVFQRRIKSHVCAYINVCRAGVFNWAHFAFTWSLDPFKGNVAVKITRWISPRPLPDPPAAFVFPQQSHSKCGKLNGGFQSARCNITRHYDQTPHPPSLQDIKTLHKHFWLLLFVGCDCLNSSPALLQELLKCWWKWLEG